MSITPEGVGERVARIEEQIQSLDRLLTTIRADDQRAIEIAQTASEKALDLAEGANEKAADKANELRGVITEALATFATKDYVLGVVREVNGRADQNAAKIAEALPREVYDSTQKEVNTRAEALAATVTSKPSIEQHDALADRVKAVEDWKNRAVGAGLILTLVSGAIGAAIARAFA